jgi:hypothetical protein
MEETMIKIPVSFYGVVDGCRPKYCGWKMVNQLDRPELIDWLRSGNRLYFKKLNMQVEYITRSKLFKVWDILKAREAVKACTTYRP